MNKTDKAVVDPQSASQASFTRMALAAARLIKEHTHPRGAFELPAASGVSSEKVTSLWYGNYAGELPSLSGKEWEALISAAEVPLDQWIAESSGNPSDPDDKVTIESEPVYGAASGYEPSDEAKDKLRQLIGLSTAFYLKASERIGSLKPPLKPVSG